MAKPGRKKQELSASPPAAAAPLLDRVEAVLERRAGPLVTALIVFGLIRIALTYPILHHTSDEPAHLACGMEWLSEKVYRYEHQHPPLTRVMAALGPYLDGVRSNRQAEMSWEGTTLLYGRSLYDRTLALARAGILPFFVLASLVVYLLGKRTFGAPGAVIAVFLFTMLPIVLAHAGLATTDMGLTATFAAASYTLVCLLERPRPATAALFGFFLGLMVLSKFSALVYFPAVVLLAALWWLWPNRRDVKSVVRRAGRSLPFLAAAGAMALVVIWGGYRFSYGETSWFTSRVPFPELFSGIDQVREHNAKGHLTYLLGSQSMDGWWLYFPALITVKTPLAVLLLLLAGLIWKAPHRPGSWPHGPLWIVPCAILAVAIPARINIGLRHILPAFPFLALLAGGGALALRERARTRRLAGYALCALLLWTAATSLLAHPDYLAYFNAFAGDQPEKIVVDSDLDWGQDIKRLGLRLQQLSAPSVAFTTPIYTSFAYHGFPPVVPNQPEFPAPGWNAVSLSQWKLYRMGLQREEPQLQLWVDRARPIERVGKSILLFYFPPGQGRPR